MDSKPTSPGRSASEARFVCSSAHGVTANQTKSPPLPQAHLSQQDSPPHLSTRPTRQRGDPRAKRYAPPLAGGVPAGASLHRPPPTNTQHRSSTPFRPSSSQTEYRPFKHRRARVQQFDQADAPARRRRVPLSTRPFSGRRPRRRSPPATHRPRNHPPRTVAPPPSPFDPLPPHPTPRRVPLQRDRAPRPRLPHAPSPARGFARPHPRSGASHTLINSGAPGTSTSEYARLNATSILDSVPADASPGRSASEARTPDAASDERFRELPGDRASDLASKTGAARPHATPRRVPLQRDRDPRRGRILARLVAVVQEVERRWMLRIIRRRSAGAKRGCSMRTLSAACRHRPRRPFAGRRAGSTRIWADESRVHMD